MVESESNGIADLNNAYGSKILDFEISKNELLALKKALYEIYEYPEKFVVFELCLEEERIQTLSDIKEILSELDNCIERK